MKDAKRSERIKNQQEKKKNNFITDLDEKFKDRKPKQIEFKNLTEEFDGLKKSKKRKI